MIGTKISDMLMKPAIIKKIPMMNWHNIKVRAKIIQVNIPNSSVSPPIKYYI